MLRHQFAVRLLREGPAAQRQDGRPSAFDPAYVLPQDLGLDPPELRLAALLENFGDAGPLGGFNLVIDIEEVPAHAMCQVAPDSRLPGTHKTDQVDAGRALQSQVHAGSTMAAMRRCASPGKSR